MAQVPAWAVTETALVCFMGKLQENSTPHPVFSLSFTFLETPEDCGTDSNRFCYVLDPNHVDTPKTHLARLHPTPLEWICNSNK
jgi:hypothetical protein